MKKVLLAFVALMVCFSMNAQTLLEEGFNTGIPTGWVLWDDGNTPNSSAYQGGAWVAVTSGGNPAPCIGSQSWLASGAAIQCDKWIVTTGVTIPETGYAFSLEAAAYEAAFPDGFQVRVCTGTPSSRADFEAAPIINVPACTGEFTEYSASLDAYVGQTVYFAIIQNSVDMNILWVDNVKVFKPYENEINMVSLNLPAMAPMGTVPVTGQIQSKGSQPLTSFVLSYTVNGGDPVEETVSCNVNYGGFYTFTASTPASVPTAGNYTIAVTVSQPNGEEDPSLTNNSASGSVRVYDASQASPRTVLFEEFTTSNCGNCPGAHVRIHNALATRDNVIVVCHHDGYYTDKMTVQESTDLTWFYNAGGSTYAPASMLDRRHFDFSDNAGPVFLPGNNVGACIDEALAVPAFAEVSISNVSFDPATRQLTATVSGSLNTELANPRLSVYLVQDSIVEAQSGASANPSQMVGSKYRHMDVMRGSLLEGTWGKPIAQGSFSEQISYTMPAKIKTLTLKPWSCRLVAFVSNFDASNAGNCAVENATMSANINAPFVGIDGAAQVEMSLYPNPATDYVVLQSNEQMQEVQIVNTLGQVVYTSRQNGSELVVDTRDLAAGLYIATVRTASGVSTQRFSVVK